MMDQRDEKTHARIRGAADFMQVAARQMRRAMTPAERILWAAIRGKRLNGLRFRAQHPVGSFVLDFFCPSCKLVVEVDGGIHDGEEERDRARTQYLSAYGYRVIRFRNEEILTALDTVLARILDVALSLSSS